MRFGDDGLWFVVYGLAREIEGREEECQIEKGVIVVLV